jgi:hypothetical protein
MSRRGLGGGEESQKQEVRLEAPGVAKFCRKFIISGENGRDVLCVMLTSQMQSHAGCEDPDSVIFTYGK